MSSFASPLLLEVLEGRIVPAVLVHGANVLGGSVDGVSMDREGYNGTPGHDATWLAVEVHRGQIIVWYDGFSEEIMGISVGENASFSVYDDVFGDIVTNLAGNGKLSDSDNDPTNGYDGRVLLPWDIRDVTILGAPDRIIAGGSVSNVRASFLQASLFWYQGDPEGDPVRLAEGGIYTGNGIFKAERHERLGQLRPGPEGAAEGTYTISFGEFLDLDPERPGFQNSIVLEEAFAQYGRRFDITDIDLTWSNGAELWAGDGITVEGGRGTGGGNIENITGGFGTPPTPGGFIAVAGDGGGGANGGIAGSISNVQLNGDHPFVVLQAGRGGDGAASGGDGGRIRDLEIAGAGEFRFIEINGGNGGDGFRRGGRGGEIVNLDLTGGNHTVEIIAGSGGDSARRGGDGGRIFSATIELEITDDTPDPGPDGGGDQEEDEEEERTQQAENFVMLAGNGGAASEGSAGRGGVFSEVTISGDIRSAQLGAGHGGEGAARGGNGGMFYRVTSTVSLSDEFAGEWMLRAGNGGNSVSGTGGAGGNLFLVQHDVNPADQQTARIDTTFRSVIFAGSGGNGAVNGGAGGHIRQFTSVVTHDQQVEGGYVLNPAVIGLHAGNGGNGGTGAGGNGGSVTLAPRPDLPLRGYSYFDVDRPHRTDQEGPEAEAIQVTGGDGGAGARRGGAGGNVVGVYVGNARLGDGAIPTNTMLKSALLQAGDGGDSTTGRGGTGGTVLNSEVVVQNRIPPFADIFPELFADFAGTHGGRLTVMSGSGGDSEAGAGGSGGHVRQGHFGSVSPDVQTFQRGILVVAGSGGDGSVRGGKGGNIDRLEVHTPSIERAYGGVFIAGHGGDADGVRGIGGNGGGIGGIKQHQDRTSYINLVHAGNGGDGTFRGGNGGNVNGVTTIGLIGTRSVDLVPQGAFATEIPTYGAEEFVASDLLPQGVFAGRGGAGDMPGNNGRVLNIQAQTIAAIGAGPDANNQFAPASMVSGIRARTIGFELDGDQFFQPGEGFILAERVGRIDTDNPLRTERFTNPPEAFVVTA